MKIHAPHIHSHLQAATNEPKDRNADLRDAARQFEGLLLGELFRVMRQSVPESDLFGGGLSQDLFTGMLDEQLARQAANGSGLGIAHAIAEQLSPGSSTPTEIHSVLNDGGWVRPLGRRLAPLAAGQRFGAAREGDRPGECGEGHCGIDVGAKIGTQVVSVSDGVVRAVGRDPDSSAGLYVEVAHRKGDVVSRYLHLDAIAEDLQPGQPVEGGQPIGTVGDTGTTAKGAHLHFELKARDGRGSRRFVDPEPYLKMWPSSGFLPQVSKTFVDDSVDGTAPAKVSDLWEKQ